MISRPAETYLVCLCVFVSDCDLEPLKIRGSDPDLGSGATGKYTNFLYL
jgi:hypothetical protein